jgi:hypothetical protein
MGNFDAVSGEVMMRTGSTANLADVFGGSGQQVGDTLNFLAPDINETAKQPILAPSQQPWGCSYQVNLFNGTATTMTFILYNKEEDWYAELTRVTVDAGNGKTIMVKGWLSSGEGAVSSIAGAADAESGRVVVRRL